MADEEMEIYPIDTLPLPVRQSPHHPVHHHQTTDSVCFDGRDIAFLIRTESGRWIANDAVPLSYE